jgi:hypothetical protein
MMTRCPACNSPDAQVYVSSTGDDRWHYCNRCAFQFAAAGDDVPHCPRCRGVWGLPENGGFTCAYCGHAVNMEHGRPECPTECLSDAS